MFGNSRTSWFVIYYLSCHNIERAKVTKSSKSVEVWQRTRFTMCSKTYLGWLRKTHNNAVDLLRNFLRYQLKNEHGSFIKLITFLIKITITKIWWQKLHVVNLEMPNLKIWWKWLTQKRTHKRKSYQIWCTQKIDDELFIVKHMWKKISPGEKDFSKIIFFFKQ